MKNTILVLFLLVAACGKEARIGKIILISANAEWRVVKSLFPDAQLQQSPWGEFFERDLPVGNSRERVIFFHGGWGKVAAAGSAQYYIDRWKPAYVVNIGTCGGFEGMINRNDIVLVDKAVIYDIEEAMGNAQEAINDYTTEIDLDWLGQDYPTQVTRTLLVSGDRDLVPAQVTALHDKYHAIAGDWETGAIVYTCARNNQRVLVLRGVTDLVSQQKGEAYGNNDVFIRGTETVMKRLVADLPLWLERCR